LLAGYKDRGVPAIPFPAEKDETDLALAAAHALTLNPSFILILGALGGRADHALANLHVLALAKDVPTEIWDETTSITLINKKSALPKNDYVFLSLIPLTTEVIGITTQGLFYPLAGETLRAGETRGVSNAFTAEAAVITIESGMLLAIRSK
jgi:thiamine pyrophosphokinase